MDFENQSNQANALDEIKSWIFEHLDELERGLISSNKEIEDHWRLTFLGSFWDKQTNMLNNKLHIEVQIKYLEDILEFIDTDFRVLTDTAKAGILLELSKLSEMDISREDQRVKMREMDTIRKTIDDIVKMEIGLLKDWIFEHNIDDLMAKSLFYNSRGSSPTRASDREINDIFAKAYLDVKDSKWRENFKLSNFKEEWTYSLDGTREDIYEMISRASKNMDDNTLLYFHHWEIIVYLNGEKITMSWEEYTHGTDVDERYEDIFNSEIDRRNWKKEVSAQLASLELPKKKINNTPIPREKPENQNSVTISQDQERIDSRIPSKREVIETINNSQHIRTVIELLIRKELSWKEIGRREEDWWKIDFTSEYINIHIDEFIDNFIHLILLFWEIESNLNPQWRNGYNREWVKILKVWQKASSAKGAWQYLTENWKYGTAYEYEFKRKDKPSVWRFLWGWEKPVAGQARRKAKYWKTSSHETANNNVFDFAENIKDPELKALLDWIAPNFIDTPTSWLDARKLTIEQQAIMFVIDLFKNPRSVKNANEDRVYVRDYLGLAAHGNTWSQDMIYAIFHHTSPDDKWVRDNMARWRRELNRLLGVESKEPAVEKSPESKPTRKPDLVAGWSISSAWKVVEALFPDVYDASNPWYKHFQTSNIDLVVQNWDQYFKDWNIVTVKRWNTEITKFKVWPNNGNIVLV